MKETKTSDFQKPLNLSDDLRVAAQEAAQQHNKTPPPFSIRFTSEERAALDKAAAGMPLGAYIRQKLFEGELTPRRTRGVDPVKDHAALAKVLGALGASRLSSNLNQIAKAAHVGALPVTPELEDELKEACDKVRDMRANLMRALGFQQSEEPP